MFDKHHLDNDFQKIDNLYLDYLKASANPDDAKRKLQIKEKLIIAFWRTMQKASSITPTMIEHTDILVKTINNCLDTCSTNNDFHGFCKYTYSSIVRALKSKADTAAFEEKVKMHVTSGEDEKRKLINRNFKNYKTFNNGSAEDFINYALKYLDLEVKGKKLTRKDFEEYLFPKTTSSLYVKGLNEDDSEVCIVDQYMDTDQSELETKVENKENFVSKFIELNKYWSLQKESAKSVLSELITRDCLDDMSKHLSNFSSSDSEDIEKLLCSYDFICKEMIHSFFMDINYKIPTQQDIALKYGLTKAGASKKLSRFYEGIREKSPI